MSSGVAATPSPVRAKANVIRAKSSRDHDSYIVLIAVEAQGIVRDAAQPISPGENIKAQMQRAWNALGRPAFWRVRAAWHGEAGRWSAAALEDLRARDRARRRPPNAMAAAG